MVTALSLLEGDYIAFKDSSPGDGDRCIVRFSDGSKLDAVLTFDNGGVRLENKIGLCISDGMAALAIKQGVTMDILMECGYTVVNRAVKTSEISRDEFIQEMVALGKKLLENQ